MTLANVTLTNTFDEWRVRTNQLISVYDETNLLSRAAYNATNSFVSSTANLTANIIVSNTIVYNTIYTNANVIAFDVSANLANIIAENTTVQTAVNDSANTLFLNYLANVNFNYGGAIANAAFLNANAAFLNANAAFNQANTANQTSISAFDLANTSQIRINLNDETTTDLTRYITFIDANNGNINFINVSSSKLTFNPNTGTLSATIFNSTSDITQKRDILEIRSPLFMVRQMRGVGFNWIETGRKSYGVIAQELEQVLPELVDETNGIKSVNYSGIIAFLIEAIKELEQKIEKQ